MTQVKMPEPVAWATPDLSKLFGENEMLTLERLGGSREKQKTFFSVPLITTTQAEAYADARVAESQQWISVDDRLPPDDETEVIAVHGGNETEIVWGWLIHETHADRTYTHWMPLPPLPTK